MFLLASVEKPIELGKGGLRLEKGIQCWYETAEGGLCQGETAESNKK